MKKVKLNKKIILIIYDLWYLRYKIMGGEWYDLTDYLREKLTDDGYKISYDDKHEDIIFNGYSLKKLLEL